MAKNSNVLIDKFTSFNEKQNYVPFQNNKLLNNNVHVMNNLNNLMQQKKMGKIAQSKNIPQKKKLNIIEEILQPEKIEINNKDIESNLYIYENQRKENIKRTFEPYKIIIKDKLITKELDPYKFNEEIVVHRSTKEDANIIKFNEELNDKKNEDEKINKEIKLEFSLDNYSVHKKKFEYKDSFIKNLSYEQQSFDDNKSDYIEFYKNKQKELEDGKKLCDQILHTIMKEDIIKKEELPDAKMNNE